MTCAICNSIVNPRCDDCGMTTSTPRPDQIGFPRQCRFCQQKAEAEHQVRLRNWMSQERPRNRRVHVVKLPEGMRPRP
ncbi:hypothetical protein B2G69_07225 [Methylorubrum zatmanii]|nr:hypothetical protein [Methylorubrum zatmanii]ARO53961.1 hypothetical protein B2G69_07225 [Methylorubrum zatmanii]